MGQAVRYESEESLLKIEGITAINGSGKQLTASITFLIEETYKEQLVCQLDSGLLPATLSVTEI